MLAAAVPLINGKWEVKEVPKSQPENGRWVLRLT